MAKREHMARADQYVKENKLAEAVIEYKNTINLDARYGEARYKLAEVYERQNDAQSAFNEFIRAADLLPDREEVQVRAGYLLLLAGRYEDAKRIAEALITTHPKNIDAQIILANSMANLKDLPAAIREFESAIQNDPTRVDTYLGLASYQVVNKNPDEAVNVLRKAIAADPGSIKARLALMNIHWASGDLAKTESVVKEALALEPRNELANRALAAFYVGTGRPKEAEAPLRTLADSATTAAPKLTLAEYYLRSGRSGEAIPLLNELVSDKDVHVPASILLARWEYTNGRKDEAQKRIDEVLTKDPANASLLLLKSQFLGADGKIDEALVRAQAAAAAAPRLPDPQYAIGMLYLQKKDTEQALKAFNEVLRLDPASADALLQVAKIQLASGAPNASEMALKAAEDVVRKQPRNVDARATLVRALASRGELARADAEARKLAADAPQSAEAHNLAGAMAVATKNLPAARTAYARALVLDKNSLAAFAGLVAIDMTGGKPADAKARIQARLAAEPGNPALLEVAGRAYMAMGDMANAEQAWRKLLQVQPSSLPAVLGDGPDLPFPGPPRRGPSRVRADCQARSESHRRSHVYRHSLPTAEPDGRRAEGVRARARTGSEGARRS